MEDYIESCCCFDTSQYSGVPDTAPCPGSINVPKAVEKLDALKNAGRFIEAISFTDKQKELAQSLGDWRGKLAMLSELIGMADRLIIMKDFEVTHQVERNPDLKQTDLIEYMI